MSRIEKDGETFLIDAEVLAKAFAISEKTLKQNMRNGVITSRYEKGEDSDAGKIRLSFFTSDRQVRIVTNENGKILSCVASDLPKPRSHTVGADTWHSDGGEQFHKDNDRADAKAMTSAAHDSALEITEYVQDPKIDTILDEALRQTFPASDPVAISIDGAK